MGIAELYALAWFTFSPLFLYVDNFEVNEIPNTLSLIYDKHKLNERHIAFPLKIADLCSMMADLQEGEAIITNDGEFCYVFKMEEPMYRGKRVAGSAKAYFRNGHYYTVSDYTWELLELGE